MSEAPKLERTYLERLKAMLDCYAPQLSPKAETILADNEGKEEEFLKSLIESYGPEPVRDIQLDYAETFGYLTHEREDVRKMAANGLAGHSLKNPAMIKYLKEHEESAKTLIAMLSERQQKTLSDVLSICVNLAADSTASDILLPCGLVPRCMRLLDGIGRGEITERANTLTEMVLMILNNTTATHVVAVHELLQLDDEDLKGFFFGKLKTFYDRCECDDDDEEEAAAVAAPADKLANDDGEAPQESKIVERKEDPKKRLRQWYLQICLNVTRLPDGQRLVAEDDEWLPELLSLLESDNTASRALAAQTLRNVSSLKDAVPNLVAAAAHQKVVKRLVDHEEPAHVQAALMDFVSCLLASEAGVEALEGINARKYLLEAAHIKGEAAETLKAHVLPFLDEIVDAHMIEQ